MAAAATPWRLADTRDRDNEPGAEHIPADPTRRKAQVRDAPDSQAISSEQSISPTAAHQRHRLQLAPLRSVGLLRASTLWPDPSARRLLGNLMRNGCTAALCGALRYECRIVRFALQS